MKMKKMIKPIKPNLRWDKINVLIFDCDGVLTDGRIIYDSNGAEIKNFDAHDGMGFLLLQQTDLITVVITGRNSSVLQRRCEDLKIKYLYQGVANKLEITEQLLSELNLDFSHVMYMGDDWNDLPVMFKANISVCPADACQDIQELSDHVTRNPGGRGAVRECIEMVLNNKGMYEQAVQTYLNKIS
jgi:3-deoxy-D-manno-octulosonate 8-phosphate phosphatase (KDO 8-P phosphatase)